MSDTYGTRIWTDDDGYIDVEDALTDVVQALQNDGEYAWFTDSTTNRECAVNRKRVIGAVAGPASDA